MENLNIPNTTLIPPSPQINIQNLKPFPRFCMSIGAIPTSYMYSLSYEEQLLWLCKFLQDTVIPAVNNNGQAVAELQALYIQLKDYVDNYFTNLDVQQEINNKLDEMAENGTLANIINIFIANSQFTFNTINDMKNSTKLSTNCKVRTFGYFELNDGGGADYLIREKTAEDKETGNIIFINNSSLVAELIPSLFINSLQFGCIFDGVTDTTTNLQNFINYLQNKNITGILKSGTYICNGYLNITGSSHLIGEDNVIIKHTALPQDEQFIKITANNIIFENITFKNQGYRTNIIMDNSTFCGMLFKIENTNNIHFINCTFEDIYSYGVCVYSTSDIYFNKCTLKNATYNMLMLYQETENIYIENCVFDGVYSSNSSGNAYLFATGDSNYDVLHEFRTKNLNINNCVFKNNLFWEGVDTHGCEIFNFTNNLIENCKQGLMCRLDSRPITPCNHGNILIENNIFIGTSQELHGSYAINAGSSNTKQCKNFTIKNNKISNYGYKNNYSGSVILISIDNCFFDNNIVENTFSRFMYIMGVTNCIISNNTFKNILNKYTEEIGYIGILIRQRSIVNYINNYMHSDIQLNKGVYGSTIERSYFQEENNITLNTLKNYEINNFFEGNKEADVTACVGSKIKNQYGIPIAYSTSDGFNSKLINRARCAGEVGSNVITITNDTGFRNLIKYDYIQINDAGENGENLQTQVLDYDNDRKLIIKDTIKTAVSNAAVFTKEATWVDM